ncbi:HK97 family phage prohead protease, partial [Escherichia coli]
MNDREIRCYSGEVRAERHDDNPAHIIGYGSVFDCRSELIFGSF